LILRANRTKNNQILSFSTIGKVWAGFLSSPQKKKLVEEKHSNIKHLFKEMFYPVWLNIGIHINMFANRVNYLSQLLKMKKTLVQFVINKYQLP